MGGEGADEGGLSGPGRAGTQQRLWGVRSETRAGSRCPDRAGEGPHSGGCDRGEDGAWAVPPAGGGHVPN